jgi:hypothetical protein
VQVSSWAAVADGIGEIATIDRVSRANNGNLIRRFTCVDPFLFTKRVLLPVPPIAVSRRWVRASPISSPGSAMRGPTPHRLSNPGFTGQLLRMRHHRRRLLVASLHAELEARCGGAAGRAAHHEEGLPEGRAENP